MWKYCFLVSAITTTAMCALAEYTITPSNQVAYYHYPAPPKSQQFISPAQTTNRQIIQTYQPQYQQPQQVKQQQVQQQQVQQQHVQQTYYQQQQVQQQQPQRYQQQKSQQQSRYLPPSAGKSQYPGISNNYYRSSAVTKQFTSPALDNAAFNAALTSQGYAVRSNTPAATATNNAAVRPQTTSVAQLASFAGNSGSASNSLNIKLPLPFNISPLNIAPLPLQAGTPYSALPRGVTSYGTTYPQRK